MALLPQGAAQWDAILSVATAGLLSGREVQVLANYDGTNCIIQQIVLR